MQRVLDSDACDSTSPSVFLQKIYGWLVVHVPALRAVLSFSSAPKVQNVQNACLNLALHAATDKTFVRSSLLQRFACDVRRMRSTAIMFDATHPTVASASVFEKMILSLASAETRATEAAFPTMRDQFLNQLGVALPLSSSPDDNDNNIRETFDVLRDGLLRQGDFVRRIYGRGGTWIHVDLSEFPSRSHPSSDVTENDDVAHAFPKIVRDMFVHRSRICLPSKVIFTCGYAENVERDGRFLDHVSASLPPKSIDTVVHVKIAPQQQGQQGQRERAAEEKKEHAVSFENLGRRAYAFTFTTAAASEEVVRPKGEEEGDEEERKVNDALNDVFSFIRMSSSDAAVEKYLVQDLCGDLVDFFVHEHESTGADRSRSILPTALRWRGELAFRIFVVRKIVRCFRCCFEDEDVQEEEKRLRPTVVIIDNRSNPWSIASVAITMANILSPKAWAIRAFCGRHNARYFGSALALPRVNRGASVHVEVLPSLDGREGKPIDLHMYNDVLKDPVFWRKLTAVASACLFVQDDGMLVRPGLEERFLSAALEARFPYVGAPWSAARAQLRSFMASLSTLSNGESERESESERERERESELVGNGGFSLRDPRAMLDALESRERTTTPLYDVFYDGLQCIPEDVFFSALTEGNPRRISREEASCFSMEQVLRSDALGFHKPWGYIDSESSLRVLNAYFSV